MSSMNSGVSCVCRDVLRQMEEDLGTRLDWVAVDHFNTGHPHSHVIVRGRDDQGKDLVIAQDYITDGIRLRAQRAGDARAWPGDRPGAAGQATRRGHGRVLHPHGPRHSGGGLDLQPRPAESARTSIGRCASAACGSCNAMGWPRRPSQGMEVSERLEPTMRELGERGDIVKAINRALAARGQERGPETFNLHGREVGRPVVGRLIDKQLADGIGVVIDGIDGRVHHVSLPDSSAAEQAPIGAVVEVCGAGQDGVLFEHLIGYSNIDPLIASSTRTGVGS